MTIRSATPADAAAIQRLVQRAYRCEASRAGWAHEERRGYIAGEARPFPYPTDRPIAMIAMTKTLTVAA